MSRVILASFCALVLVLVLAGPASAHGHQGEQSEPRDFATATLHPAGDGVWAVHREWAGSNSAFVLTGDGVLVFDTHVTPAAARDSVEILRTLTDAPVRWLVNSHWHTDHMMGNRAWVDAYADGSADDAGRGPSIVSHRTAREAILHRADEQLGIAQEFVGKDLETIEGLLGDPDLEPAQRDRLRRFLDDQRATLGDLDRTTTAPPDLTFEAEVTLWVASRQGDPGDPADPEPVHLLHAGHGHTEGDVVLWLPRRKILLTGDFFTLPQLYLSSDSDPVSWAARLRSLLALDFETVVTGHGGPVLHDRRVVELASRLLDAFVAQVRAAAEAGQGPDDADEIFARLDFAEVRADEDAAEVFDGMVRSFGPGGVRLALRSIARASGSAGPGT